MIVSLTPSNPLRTEGFANASMAGAVVLVATRAEALDVSGGLCHTVGIELFVLKLI